MGMRDSKKLLGCALSDDPPGLEGFVRRYADAAGGTWEQVEPQVYDLLLPGYAPGRSTDRVVRIVFDPEALPENTGAQLASLGTPLVNDMMRHARDRGRFARLHAVGLNESPRDLSNQLRRAVKVPDGCELGLEIGATLYFPQAIFWFQATFTAEQKEEEIIPVAVDLHHSREVRHLALLLDRSRLSEEPAGKLRSARHASLSRGYCLARDRVSRSLSSMANARERELGQELERQVARMTRYYADLRGEMEESLERRAARAEDITRIRERLAAIDQEERFRMSEVRRRSSLRVRLELLSLLVVHQPKVMLHATLTSPGRSPGRLEMVWDPLLGSVEAADCPACRRPGFSFALDRMSRVVCPACAGPSAGGGHRAARP